MILLVDIGNSAVKWCYSTGETLWAHGRAAWGVIGIEQALEIMGRIVSEEPDEVWVSNVAGAQAAEVLCAVTQRLWALTPRFLSPQGGDAGVAISYAKPETFGVDRWLAMVGARRSYTGALLVCDLGTAITIDSVDEGGRHRGGVIVPGVRAMLDALPPAVKAAVTPPLRAGRGFLGRSTPDCVGSGILGSVVTLLERLHSEAAAVSAEPPRCVITGADARIIEPHLTVPVIRDDELLFKGVAYAGNPVGERKA